MRQAWEIRWIFLKKEWKSSILWMLLPLIVTHLFIIMNGAIMQEIKVPIGVVVEDDSILAQELVEKIQQTDYLDVHLLPKSRAIHLLEQHELDSVFVIKRNYEKNLYLGKKRVLEGYASNRSYAYFASEELITSHAQEQATRAKLLMEVENLLEANDRFDLFDKEKIIQESKDRQYGKELIVIDYKLIAQPNMPVKQATFITEWSVWSLLTILSTLFLFDWVVKERIDSLRVRWHFLRQSFMHYALWQLFLYTLVFFIMDVIFLVSVHQFSWQLIVCLMAFRFTLNVFIFILAHFIKSIYMYYIIGIVITAICAVVGGGFIPLDGVVKNVPWLYWINPIYALLQQQVATITGFLALVIVIFYYVWGKSYAKS